MLLKSGAQCKILYRNFRCVSPFLMEVLYAKSLVKLILAKDCRTNHHIENRFWQIFHIGTTRTNHSNKKHSHLNQNERRCEAGYQDRKHRLSGRQSANMGRLQRRYRCWFHYNHDQGHHSPQQWGQYHLKHGLQYIHSHRYITFGASL